MSFLHLLETEQAQSYFKIEEEPIECHRFEGKESKGYHIRYAGKEKDVKLLILATQPECTGQTQMGIKIGSSIEDMMEQYCDPSFVYSGLNGGRFYFYEQAQIIFEVIEGKISGYYLFRTSYL